MSQRYVLVGVCESKCWSVAGMACWFWGDSRVRNRLLLRPAPTRGISKLHFEKRNSLWEKGRNSLLEGESWSKGRFSFRPGLTLTLCLSLEPDPAERPSSNLEPTAHSSLCPTFPFLLSRAKEWRHISGWLYHKHHQLRQAQSLRKFSFTKRAFLSLPLVSLPGTI